MALSCKSCEQTLCACACQARDFDKSKVKFISVPIVFAQLHLTSVAEVGQTYLQHPWEKRWGLSPGTAHTWSKRASGPSWCDCIVCTTFFQTWTHQRICRNGDISWTCGQHCSHNLGMASSEQGGTYSSQHTVTPEQSKAVHVGMHVCTNAHMYVHVCTLYR